MIDKLGRNQDDILEFNRSLVLRLIHKSQICSRAELAKQTGLTKAAITGIAQQLLQAGVISEVGLIDGAKGRRSIGLTLNVNNYTCIGMRLTRKHIRGGLFDIAGEVYAEEERKITPYSDPADAMGMMKDIAGKLLARSDGRRNLGIGLALPGPIIYREDKIAYMSAFPGWENVDIKRELRNEFGLPVQLEHDGVCFALNEWWNGGQSAGDMMLCVLVGQGVGAGMVANGKLVRGSLGCAGEIGHMSLNPYGEMCDCGSYGCTELYASTLALERSMAAKLRAHPEHPLAGTQPGYRQILECVRNGDPLAAEVYTHAARYLGFALVNIINLLNPSTIIVTDDMAECDEMLYGVLMDVLKARVSPKILERTTLVVKPADRYLAMRAATSLVIDHFLSHPMEAQANP